MKKVIISLVMLLLLPVLLHAQFSGGNGRGDYMLQSLANPLTGSENVSTTVPGAYSLEQNFPNPFNPTTNINFSVAKTGFVKIVVFDVLGREVQTLVNEKMNAGSYEVSFNGSSLYSGIYFYKISAGEFSQVKKMVLIK
ncbi:MAG: T9SS type A sorting domain-containing protein [Ignavibacteriota bacterium]